MRSFQNSVQAFCRLWTVRVVCLSHKIPREKRRCPPTKDPLYKKNVVVLFKPLSQSTVLYITVL